MKGFKIFCACFFGAGIGAIPGWAVGSVTGGLIGLLGGFDGKAMGLKKAGELKTCKDAGLKVTTGSLVTIEDSQGVNRPIGVNVKIEEFN